MAVTYVDVQPESLPLCDVGDVVDRVIASSDSGSRGGVHEEGTLAVGFVATDQAVKLAGNHPTSENRIETVCGACG